MKSVALLPAGIHNLLVQTSEDQRLLRNARRPAMSLKRAEAHKLLIFRVLFCVPDGRTNCIVELEFFSFAPVLQHPRYAVLLQAATSWTTVNHHPFGLDPVDNRHFLSDMASVSDEDRQKSIARFHGLRSELEALYNKLATIDADRGEHE